MFCSLKIVHAGIFMLACPHFNVAKYNLGQVRLELMQSAVSPLTVRDLRGAPLGICRAFVSCCFSHVLLVVDLCRSIALVSESLQCQLAAACGGGSRFQGCHGYLPFGLWLLLPANLLGTSSQAHLSVMSLNEQNRRPNLLSIIT